MMLTLCTKSAIHCTVSAFDVHDGTKINFVSECFGANPICLVQQFVQRGIDDVQCGHIGIVSAPSPIDENGVATVSFRRWRARGHPITEIVICQWATGLEPEVGCVKL